MIMYGMGQSQAQVARSIASAVSSGSSGQAQSGEAVARGVAAAISSGVSDSRIQSLDNWPAIERVARNGAGSLIGNMFDRTAAARQAATLALLARTTRAGGLARSALMRPAGTYRSALLAIAEQATARARLERAYATASSRPATVAPTSPAASAASVDEIMAAARAELARGPSGWHRDTAEVMPLIDRAMTSPFAMASLLRRFLPSVTGDARGVIALLVASLERSAVSGQAAPPSSQPVPARAAPLPGSPPASPSGEPEGAVPSMNGIGSYYSR